jgi:hypothetical protein
MLVEFALPTKRICNLPKENIDKTIWVQMEILFILDEIHWQVGENINHIHMLGKEQRDAKGKIKKFQGRRVNTMDA